MWTATLDLSPRRVLLTQLLGRFWSGAYLSSFAPLRVENVARQQLPGSHWVRVRNRLAGICGSDLHQIAVDGDLGIAPAALPGHRQTYLGHEVVGEVIEVSDEVQHIQVGDRVVLQHGINCLSAEVEQPCRACVDGNFSLCERGVFPGPHPIGGGWSEEMLLHEQQLFRVPQAMSDEQAVLIEPAAVALHAILRRVPQAGEQVLIIGAGTIGLLTLQVLRALAPQAEISVMARYPFQVEKATRMGASHIIYPQDSYREVQKVTQASLYEGMFGNRMLLGGYDVIYDTVGQRSTIHNALRWTRAKGTIVLVGLNLHFMNIDMSPIWYQEINVFGTNGHGMEKWPVGTNEYHSTFDIIATMIEREQVHPEQLITHHFALSNYRTALRTAMDKQEGRATKVIFDYSLQPASVVPNVRASARSKQRTTALAPASDAAVLRNKPVPVQAVRRPVTLPPVAPHTSIPPVLTTDEPTEKAPAISVSDTEQASVSLPDTAQMPTPTSIPLKIEPAVPAIADDEADAPTEKSNTVNEFTSIRNSEELDINEPAFTQDNNALSSHDYYGNSDAYEQDELFYTLSTPEKVDSAVERDNGTTNALPDNDITTTEASYRGKLKTPEDEETIAPLNAFFSEEAASSSQEIPASPELLGTEPATTSLPEKHIEQIQVSLKEKANRDRDKSHAVNAKRRKKTHYLVSKQEAQSIPHALSAEDKPGLQHETTEGSDAE